MILLTLTLLQVRALIAYYNSYNKWMILLQLIVNSKVIIIWSYIDYYNSYYKWIMLL